MYIGGISLSYIRSVHPKNGSILVGKQLKAIQVKTEKALFKVVGMYCVTCKPIVEKQLKNEEAVKKIYIDYMTDSVVVEFDPMLMSREEIKNKLERSGYKFVRTADAR